MQVILSNPKHPEYGQATIPLPLAQNQYEDCVELLEKLEIGSAIAELDGYMDFERYGQDCMDNDHVVQTEFGLLRRFEPPFPEQSQAQQMKGL